MVLPKTLSLSRLSSFNTCSFNHYLHYERGYRRDTTSPALSKGSYFHALVAGEKIDWQNIGELSEEDKQLVDRAFGLWKGYSPQLFADLKLEDEVEFGREVNGTTVTGRADKITLDREHIFEIKTTSRSGYLAIPQVKWQLNMLRYLSEGTPFTNLVYVSVKFLKTKTDIFEDRIIPVWEDDVVESQIVRTLHNMEHCVPTPVYNSMLCNYCDFKDLCLNAMPAGYGENWLAENCYKKEEAA